MVRATTSSKRADADPLGQDHPGAVPPVDAGSTADGRVRRGARNRDALVEALLALLESGVSRPTALQIAERAGVSLRTVFAHFDDVEALYGAIVERQRGRYQHLYDPIPAGEPLRARVAALVRQRAELFEAIAPVRRATVLMGGTSAELNTGLAQATAALHHQAVALFAQELQAAGASRRAVTAGIDVAAGWATWDALRSGEGLSVTATRRVVELMVGRLLDG
ncbi:MAG TPA: TetR/AcrR family transcriptional regulator [Acidimicrobiia bacterium]|nr:TetR/AcrR family transcriptional regulator [Acidimicrobiia bacterium]